jgi:nicotinamidase-related amidase
MGQAKSHCVKFSIDDLLTDIKTQDPALAKKVWILEDCMDPVVIPGVLDFTQEADEAIARFKSEGMNVAKSTQPLHEYLPLS